MSHAAEPPASSRADRGAVYTQLDDLCHTLLELLTEWEQEAGDQGEGASQIRQLWQILWNMLRQRFVPSHRIPQEPEQIPTALAARKAIQRVQDFVTAEKSSLPRGDVPELE